MSVWPLNTPEAWDPVGRECEISAHARERDAYDADCARCVEVRERVLTERASGPGGDE